MIQLHQGPSPDGSARRHFSAAKRAVDPLLCEEDTNPVFREFGGMGVPKSPIKREEIGLGTIVVFAYFAFRFGPMAMRSPRTAALILAAVIAVGFIVFAIHRGTLMASRAARKGHREPRELLAGLQRTANIGMRDLWHAGTSARELVIHDYLERRRELMIGLNFWMPAVWLALAAGPLVLMKSWLLRAVLVAAWVWCTKALLRHGRARDFARFVHESFRVPWAIRGQALKFPMPAPPKVERPGGLLADSSATIFVVVFALMVLICGGGGLMTFMWDYSRQQGWGQEGFWALCGGLVVVVMVVTVVWLSAGTEIVVARTRGEQSFWVSYAERVCALEYALSDDPTPDAMAWWSIQFGPGAPPPLAEIPKEDAAPGGSW